MATEDRELSKDPKLKGVYISKFTLKDKDESLQETKPCHKEALASLHCVTWREKAECDEVVENYKRCQKFWNRVIEDREEKGIYPGLPPVRDRQKIIDEYNFLIQDKKPFFDRPV